MVVTWGDTDCDSSRVQDRLKGVQQVRATIVSAFAALWQMGQSWLGAIQIVVVTALTSKIGSKVSSKLKQAMVHFRQFWQMGQL